MTRSGAHQECHLLAPVQNMDSTIHWINLYPLDNTISFRNTCLLDSDLSGGQLACDSIRFFFVVHRLVDSAQRLNNQGWCSSLWHFTLDTHSAVQCLVTHQLFPQRNLPSSFSLERNIAWRGKERLRGRLRVLSFYLYIFLPMISTMNFSRIRCP